MRFARAVLGRTSQLQFIRALNSLEPKLRMPPADAQKLAKRLWANIDEADPLDLELLFMSEFGCRPSEASRLHDPVRSHFKFHAGAEYQKLCRNAAAYSLDIERAAGGTPSGWVFALTPEHTKTKLPYRWILPQKSHRALAGGLQKHRAASKWRASVQSVELPRPPPVEEGLKRYNSWLKAH